MNPYTSGSSSGINPNSGNLSGWSQVPATSDVDVNFNEIQNVENIYFTDGSNYSDATTTNQGIIASLSSDINSLFNPPMATYYKTTNQDFPSAVITNITFENLTSWSNTTLISQDSSSSFLVNQSGIYQLEFNCRTQPNGQTWTNFQKPMNISVVRNGLPSTSLLTIHGYANSGSTYALSLCGTMELLENDIIRCNMYSVHTGNLLIEPQNPTYPYDLNTFFTWRLVSKSFTP